MTNEIVVYAEIAVKMSVSSILCEFRHMGFCAHFRPTSSYMSDNVW